MLFLFIAFNMVSEKDNDETLDTNFNETQTENHTAGKTAVDIGAIVDA